jgi:preprotein translocase subunit SecA
MRHLERLVMLRAIDLYWVQHLTAMENLRQGIGLHAVGQRDPLVMYRTEGHKMFQALLGRIEDDVVRTIYHVQLSVPAGVRAGAARGPEKSPMAKAGVRRQQTPAVDARFRKVGRNDPCPCGSGKKFKKCHGANL